MQTKEEIFNELNSKGYSVSFISGYIDGWNAALDMAAEIARAYPSSDYDGNPTGEVELQSITGLKFTTQ